MKFSQCVHLAVIFYMRFSKYYEGLESADKERYEEKVQCVQTDPYCLTKGQWKEEVAHFPAVGHPDIINYLLLTTSRYTADQLKAYKSLEAYNQFVSGWVQEVGAVTPPNNEALRIISARVSYAIL